MKTNLNNVEQSLVIEAIMDEYEQHVGFRITPRGVVLDIVADEVAKGMHDEHAALALVRAQLAGFLQYPSAEMATRAGKAQPVIH